MLTSMRGRLPKPTQLKIVQGTQRRDRMNPDEPVVPEGDVVMPTYLKGRARKFWHYHAPILTAMGLLTVADVAMLAELCETEAEFWTARDDVRKRGIEIESTRYDRKTDRPYTVTEDNPSVKIASDAGKRMKAILVEFGLSPSSRTRVKAQKPVEVDPLAELMAQRNAR